jgi:hypothetical protein
MTKIFTRNPFLKSFKPFAILALLCLFLITNFSFAQDKNTKPMQESVAPKSVPSQSRNISEEDLRKKLSEIENSGVSPEEFKEIKLRLYKDAGIDISILNQEVEFSFKPKYIPMAQMENWKAIALAKNPNALKFIAVVNPAYFLDYNNYGDRMIDKRVADLAFQNPIDENLALKHVLPDLTLLRSLLPEGASLVPNLRIFFAANPELFNMMPMEMAAKTKTDIGIQTLTKMQDSSKK